jgi:glycosyltransferase involved in cell wall biosynthesis
VLQPSLWWLRELRPNPVTVLRVGEADGAAGMSAPRMPRVSFVLAVYNDARFLPETLAAIFNQSFDDFELVVVDDHSDDGSRDALTSTGDPRVRYMRNHTNLGLTPSLNRALGACRGELVARIDGDDVCERDRLLHQVRYMDEHPELAGCATWTTEMDENGKVIGAVEPNGDPVYIQWMLCHANRLYHSTMMLRRNVLVEMRGYDEGYVAAQDYELWTRMLQSGFQLGVVPRRLVRYRRRPGSITDTKRQIQLAAGLRVATRYVNGIMGQDFDKGVVDAMRRLLSWERPKRAGNAPRWVREALALMRRLRKRILLSASTGAVREADAEVAAMLLRHGKYTLHDAPHVAAQLAWYVARLPRHRRRGWALALVAARCTAGNARRRILASSNRRGKRMASNQNLVD